MRVECDGREMILMTVQWSRKSNQKPNNTHQHHSSEATQESQQSGTASFVRCNILFSRSVAIDSIIILFHKYVH